MTPAIRVENLGKCYRVSQAGRRARYRTLRESLVEAVTAPFRGRGTRGTTPEEFWALREVAFEVQPGEVMGIIGRNGAGKSTLLKVLSRITSPTAGAVELRGRVGSLLEVGTGFHPELTGRENVYLNGSILGMSRKEIDQRFDEIVAFAEVEEFLDVPVKRYSSGMYVRLAFAVAAHMEPEIFLIDEVLAVGDAVFQRRCLERMSQLARGGCTLLFVSHNLDVIPRFCQTAVLLDGGRLVSRGEVSRVLDRYRSELAAPGGAGDLRGKPRRGSGRARFVAIHFLDPDGREVGVIRSGEDLRCVLDVESTYESKHVSLAVVVKTVQGSRVLTSWTEEMGFNVSLSPGRQRLECRFLRVPLRPGRRMMFEVWMHDGETVDLVEDACVLDVVETTASGVSSRSDQGAVICPYEWVLHPRPF